MNIKCHRGVKKLFEWPLSKIAEFSDVHTNTCISEALLNWKTVEKKMPWELVFLLGGGFALAKGTSVSGLSTFLGVQLESLQVLYIQWQFFC